MSLLGGTRGLNWAGTSGYVRLVRAVGLLVVCAPVMQTRAGTFGVAVTGGWRLRRPVPGQPAK